MAGIALIHGGSNTVSQNHIWDSGKDGIAVHESFDNTIDRNHSSGNLLDGIGIKDHPGNPVSAGNFIERNHLSENAEHDRHDDSVGAGTAGTGNGPATTPRRRIDRDYAVEPDDEAARGLRRALRMGRTWLPGRGSTARSTPRPAIPRCSIMPAPEGRGAFHFPVPQAARERHLPGAR